MWYSIDEPVNATKVSSQLGYVHIRERVTEQTTLAPLDAVINTPLIVATDSDDRLKTAPTRHISVYLTNDLLDGRLCDLR